MNILIIDDDKQLCSILNLFFKKYNYNVNIVHSGEDALSFLELNHQDLDIIILDLYMSGICGIETCKKIRFFSEVPILMLTSCNEDVQTILALEFGVDDYMLKPFTATVLLAKIKAILRRSSNKNIVIKNQLSNKYCFSDCILDLGMQTLSFKKVNIPITTGVFQILKYFIEHQNVVISRETLIKNIRNKHIESYDRSIDIQVSRLRKILADCHIHNAVKTIHGSGYMWTLPVVKK
jgi:DNA-binding response OmpR family regulator